MTWHLRMRRSPCGHCPGRILAEPAAGLGSRKARRSERLAEAQTDIGMVLGGGPVLVRHDDRRCLSAATPGQATKEIARRLGASRNAVRRRIRAGQFVPYRRAPGPSRLDLTISFGEARRQQGQRSATVRHREVRAQGFTGDDDIVRRWAARQKSGAPARPPSARIPSTRRITRWLTGGPAVLSPEVRAFTDALCTAPPRSKRAAEDVRASADLLHRDDPAGLTP
ncbi:hypothetical protein mvi_41070 [Methylobacterium indicum]|uniref:Helix-turn-helix domain-containing protein n=1 Tax=Methylobacterium indicum TaxID=1775910 RepID=A0A8H8WWA5_9HYPH|nr:hypothetical protein mvi_41070 [Methylobacterium indicum]